MSSWLDGWAKRAAEAPTTPVSDAEVSSSPSLVRPASSRRDFLKKAGIVGGVAWSVPVLQTVMAPAASASVGSGVGQVCTAPNQNSGTCTDGSQCFGGYCGGAGASCAGNPTCYLSTCSGTGQPGVNAQINVCGGIGANCATTGGLNNCRTGVGCASRTGQTTCGGPGSACGTSNALCAYNNCSGDGGQDPNTCGGKGAVCPKTGTQANADLQCKSGRTCNMSSGNCQ